MRCPWLSVSILAVVTVVSSCTGGAKSSGGTAKPTSAVSSDESGKGTPPAGFALIPAGTFIMGSPVGEPERGEDETQHPVTLTRSFFLKTKEVTQDEWQAVFGSNPSKFKACGGACPVEQVSWAQVVEYANRMSRAEGLQECYQGEVFAGLGCTGYRLPTEAEWEYAARAGTTGPAYGDLGFIGWFRDNGGDTTHPIGQKQANAFGLHDMIGNVYEWTNDWYAAYGGAATDPVGPSSGPGRVCRGSFWGGSAGQARAAGERSYTDPGQKSEIIGFRLARTFAP
jgi:formylglycine-generating enzyme required for sulfatase activity